VNTIIVFEPFGRKPRLPKMTDRSNFSPPCYLVSPPHYCPSRPGPTGPTPTVPLEKKHRKLELWRIGRKTSLILTLASREDNAPSNSPPLNDGGREGDHDEDCFECWCSPDDSFCLPLRRQPAPERDNPWHWKDSCFSCGSIYGLRRG
jgi:hypothetical protein